MFSLLTSMITNPLIRLKKNNTDELRLLWNTCLPPNCPPDVFHVKPNLQFCLHIWGGPAPTTCHLLDAIQQKAIKLSLDLALSFKISSFAHRRTVGDLRFFYGYFNSSTSNNSQQTKYVIITYSAIHCPTAEASNISILSCVNFQGVQIMEFAIRRCFHAPKSPLV